MRNFILLVLTACAFTFAGNCGSSDTFLTCNPANVALLPKIGTFSDSNSFSVRTGVADYKQGSAYAFSRYLVSGSGSLIVDTTFKAVVLGTSTADTATVRCQKVYNSVGCIVSGVTGTSDSVGFATLAFPSGWRTATALNVGGLSVLSGGVTRKTGSAVVNTSGTLVFSFADTAGVAAVWANSGTKTVGTFFLNFLK